MHSRKVHQVHASVSFARRTQVLQDGVICYAVCSACSTAPTQTIDTTLSQQPHTHITRRSQFYAHATYNNEHY
jgi:hypothetical protein